MLVLQRPKTTNDNMLLFKDLENLLIREPSYGNLRKIPYPETYSSGLNNDIVKESINSQTF